MRPLLSRYVLAPPVGAVLVAVLAGFAFGPTASLSPRFNHVMLYVSDLEASIEFYTEAFGVEVGQRVESITVVAEDGSESPNSVRMAFLRFPGQEFVLELSQQPVGGDGLDAGEGARYQHLGVDVLDIRAAADRVQEAGATDFTGIRRVRTNTGTEALNAFFRGPDGELLELMEVVAGEF